MHAEVVDDKPGKCPICQMVLAPVRLALVWSCPVHTAVAEAVAGRCRQCGRDLIRVTRALTFTCRVHRQGRRVEPGGLSGLPAPARRQVFNPAARQSQPETRRVLPHGLEQLAPRGHPSGPGGVPDVHLRQLLEAVHAARHGGAHHRGAGPRRQARDGRRPLHPGPPRRLSARRGSRAWPCRSTSPSRSSSRPATTTTAAISCSPTTPRSRPRAEPSRRSSRARFALDSAHQPIAV